MNSIGVFARDLSKKCLDFSCQIEGSFNTSTTLKYHSSSQWEVVTPVVQNVMNVSISLVGLNWFLWLGSHFGLACSFLFPGEILSFVGYIHILHGWLNLHFSWFDPPKPCRFHGGAAGKRSRSGGAAMVRPRNFH